MTTVFEEMMTGAALNLNDDAVVCDTCMDQGHDDCQCGHDDTRNFGIVKDFSNPAESIEEQLEKLQARKLAKLQEEEDAEELDLIQAAAEALEEAEDDDSKAQKKALAKQKRLLKARANFLKNKVQTQHIETVTAHTRSYRTRPCQANSLGVIETMDVLDQDALVLVCYAQPNAPQLTANGTNDRGGRKRSSDEDGTAAGTIHTSDMHTEESVSVSAE